MKCVRIGDTEISAAAISLRGGGYLSAVTIVHRRSGTSGIESHHEWDEPLFESESEALRFAWRRAVLMAQSLKEAHE
jgi:hypothetical protein